MNLTMILGILAVLAGIAILIWPTLLNVIVALALIVLGAYITFAGWSRRPIAG